MKILAMWVSLCVLLVASFWGVFSAIVPFLPSDTMSGFEIVVFVAGMIPTIAVCVYLAVSVWLILWRVHTTKKEIYRVAGAGPLSRFDHWLIQKLGPQE